MAPSLVPHIWPFHTLHPERQTCLGHFTRVLPWFAFLSLGSFLPSPHKCLGAQRSGVTKQGLEVNPTELRLKGCSPASSPPPLSKHFPLGLLHQLFSLSLRLPK